MSIRVNMMNLRIASTYKPHCDECGYFVMEEIENLRTSNINIRRYYKCPNCGFKTYRDDFR